MATNGVYRLFQVPCCAFVDCQASNRYQTRYAGARTVLLRTVIQELKTHLYTRTSRRWPNKEV